MIGPRNAATASAMSSGVSASAAVVADWPRCWSIWEVSKICPLSSAKLNSNICLSSPPMAPPNSSKPVAPAIRTSAVPRSLDWGTCPSSRAFSSRLGVGSSVFSWLSSPPPSAMECPPDQVCCISRRKTNVSRLNSWKCGARSRTRTQLAKSPNSSAIGKPMAKMFIWGAARVITPNEM